MKLLILLLTIYAIYKLSIYIANNISFIGKNCRLKIIFITLLVDFIIFVVCILTLGICRKNNVLDFSIGMLIALIIMITAIVSLNKIFKTITEHKTLKSTLMNCTIRNINIGYKLVGDSLEGNKNTFILYGKDGKDIYRAMYNGVATFDITYYSSSKRIVNIKLLPYGPSQQLLNMYYTNNTSNNPKDKKSFLSK